MENTITPERLFELASEQYYKVYDFGPKTKKSDKRWIRVGIVPDPNKEIQWNYFNGIRLLCEENFDKAENFTDGTAVVIRNHEYNVLRDDGTFVFDRWYNYAARCEDGKHYCIEINTDKYGVSRIEAFADKDGKIVSDWYDQITPMMHGNLYCVAKGRKIPERKYAMFSLETYKVESDWYDSMMMFQWNDMLGKPLARVKKGNLYNLIGTDASIVFGIWSKKPIEVRKDGSCQIYAEDGTVYNANVKTGETNKI